MCCLLGSLGLPYAKHRLLGTSGVCTSRGKVKLVIDHIDARRDLGPALHSRSGFIVHDALRRFMDANDQASSNGFSSLPEAIIN